MPPVLALGDAAYERGEARAVCEHARCRPQPARAGDQHDAVLAPSGWLTARALPCASIARVSPQTVAHLELRPRVAG